MPVTIAAACTHAGLSHGLSRWFHEALSCTLCAQASLLSSVLCMSGCTPGMLSREPRCLDARWERGNAGTSTPGSCSEQPGFASWSSLRVWVRRWREREVSFWTDGLLLLSVVMCSVCVIRSDETLLRLCLLFDVCRWCSACASTLLSTWVHSGAEQTSDACETQPNLAYVRIIHAKIALSSCWHGLLNFADWNSCRFVLFWYGSSSAILALHACSQSGGSFWPLPGWRCATW